MDLYESFKVINTAAGLRISMEFNNAEGRFNSKPRTFTLLELSNEIESKTSLFEDYGDTPQNALKNRDIRLLKRARATLKLPSVKVIYTQKAQANPTVTPPLLHRPRRDQVTTAQSAPA